MERYSPASRQVSEILRMVNVVVLAAGSGRRMGGLTTNSHKALLPIDDKLSFLTHLLKQLSEYCLEEVNIVTGYRAEDIEEAACGLNVKTVFNPHFSEDVNIFSLYLGLSTLKNRDVPTVVLEADIYLDDLAMSAIISEAKTGQSVWFTRGQFFDGQKGGILRRDHDRQVTEIKIVEGYSSEYRDYFKLLGAMSIGPHHIETYIEMLSKYMQKTMRQYYLPVWFENLTLFPCRAADLSKFVVDSFNTESEYRELLSRLKKNDIAPVQLVEVTKLRPIEGIVPQAIDPLQEKILADGVWKYPIIVDDEDYLVLDGHHRLEVAKRMGFRRVPVTKLRYQTVPCWSLRDNHAVDHELVRTRALKADLYPEKTVKHQLPQNLLFYCDYKIEQLLG